MSFAATSISPAGGTNGSQKAFSQGPYKVEYFTWTCASGDTGGTITAKSLHTVIYCEITGCTQTALPTYSNATATVAFSDPVATVYGQAKLYGF